MSLAFGLGWDMTYLFTYVGDEELGLPYLLDRLPSLSRLPEQKRSLIRLDRIRGPVMLFRERFEASGIGNLVGVVREIEEQLWSGVAIDEIRNSLCDLHYLLMRAFTTIDNRLAKAYRLGRSLGTTCHVSDSQSALRDEFDPNRLARLDEWLADLASQLPPHASRPVRLSLSAWREWLVEPRIDQEGSGVAGRVGLPLTTRDRPLDWALDGESVRNTLKRQGDLWRALLSGEKRGEAMLELPDFVSAAFKIPRYTLRLISIMALPLAISTILIAVGTFIVLDNPGLTNAIAGFGTIFLGLLGVIGFTWQGTLEAVRRSTAEIKKPIWGAVLDEEIARAITDLPPGAVFEPKNAEVAAPAIGPAAWRRG